MKYLTFSITLNNHTFNIRTNNKYTLCSYVVDGVYKTSLVFGANTHAYVSYKNTTLSGAVTKQDNWKLFLDRRIIIQKRYNNIFFETTKPMKNVDIEKATVNSPTSFPKNILYLYDLLIKEFSKLHSDINDKTNFKNQICEYLKDDYYYVENPYEILEYEEDDDGDIYKEPIIKRITVIDEIINNTKDFFTSFRQSELDINSKELIFTLENVINEFPDLREIPQEFLQEEFNNYLDKHNNELTKPHIYYNQLDCLHAIGKHIYDAYQYLNFMNTLETRINKIISTMDHSIVNKEELYSYFKTAYRVGYTPNDKDFTQSVKDYVDFCNLYNNFVNLFDCDDIKIVWDDKTIQLFEKYDKKEISIDSQYFAEYEAYKFITPYYKKHFFIKNSNNYKPVIKKLPDFISYGTSIYDILFKYNILIDSGDKVLYNEEGDVNSAYKEMREIGVN